MNKTIVGSVATVVIALVVAGGALGAAQSGRTAAERELREEITSVKQQIATLEDNYQTESVGALKEVTGVDPARISSDAALIRDIASAATTWSDYDSYVASRAAIVEDGVAEDSTLLTDFMPAPVEYTGVDGDARNTIDDAAATTQFSSIDTYCRKVDGDSYSYVSLVTASSHVGTANEEATYVFETVTGPDGSIRSISAAQAF